VIFDEIHYIQQRL